MANGEEIKLGGLLTDKQVAQISTLINEFKQEFNTQKSDSLVNQYMTAFDNQQLPPPAPAPAPDAPPAPAPAVEQSQVNGGHNRTGANITGNTDGIVIKPHQQEDQQDTGASSYSDGTMQQIQLKIQDCQP